MHPLFVAVTVKENDPHAVGVPLISPLTWSSVRFGGSSGFGPVRVNVFALVAGIL